jgi:hypothetical protein
MTYNNRRMRSRFIQHPHDKHGILAVVQFSAAYWTDVYGRMWAEIEPDCFTAAHGPVAARDHYLWQQARTMAKCFGFHLVGLQK